MKVTQSLGGLVYNWTAGITFFVVWRYSQSGLSIMKICIHSYGFCWIRLAPPRSWFQLRRFITGAISTSFYPRWHNCHARRNKLTIFSGKLGFFYIFLENILNDKWVHPLLTSHPLSWLVAQWCCHVHHLLMLFLKTFFDALSHYHLVLSAPAIGLPGWKYYRNWFRW